jgi:hypothetical protein
MDRQEDPLSRPPNCSTWRVAAIILSFAIPVGLPANAQHNHAQGHDVYRNWVNQQDTGCCNNQDCGEIDDQDVKDDGSTVEVRIEGEWCVIRPWMYTKKGNAPNGDVNHACVLHKDNFDSRSPCQRLICFQPKTGY